MKTKLHVIGIPHTKTNKDYVSCAFTQNVLNFCEMFKNDEDFTIIHYGNAGSVLPEGINHVDIFTEEEFAELYPSNLTHDKCYEFDNKENTVVFNNKVIAAIGELKSEGDIILSFWGSPNKDICDAHSDLRSVEAAIGYASEGFADYRVFPSYAALHALLGPQRLSNCNPQWNRLVIPHYFDINDFTYKEEKSDYVLFIGRVIAAKGIGTIINACIAANQKLIIAGQIDDGMYEIISSIAEEHTNIIIHGHANLEERAELLANAKALITLPQYIEPFGCVQIEALLSGTPVICPDFGAFVEIITNGIVGYRCRTPNELIYALNNVKYCHPDACRSVGLAYNLISIKAKYKALFNEIVDSYSNTPPFNM